MMPDLDTDSAMMRQQQDRDTPQLIGDGGRAERSDSDDRSRADREAAKNGTAEPSAGPAPAPARDDRHALSADPSHLVAMRNAALARSAGLVRRGRSLLGN